jgi:hypothetical protein
MSKGLIKNIFREVDDLSITEFEVIQNIMQCPGWSFNLISRATKVKGQIS